jgi:hypothetical protein
VSPLPYSEIKEKAASKASKESASEIKVSFNSSHFSLYCSIEILPSSIKYFNYIKLVVNFNNFSLISSSVKYCVYLS